MVSSHGSARRGNRNNSGSSGYGGNNPLPVPFQAAMDRLRSDGFDVTGIEKQHEDRYGAKKDPRGGDVSGPSDHDGSPSGGVPASGQTGAGGGFVSGFGQTSDTAAGSTGADQAKDSGGLVPGSGQDSNTAKNPGGWPPSRQPPRSSVSGRGGIQSYPHRGNKGQRGNKQYGGISKPSSQQPTVSSHGLKPKGFLQSQVDSQASSRHTPWEITWATRAHLIEYVDEAGRTATEVINTSVGGRDQSRFACSADRNSILAKGTTPRDAAELVEGLLKSTSCSGYTMILQPNQQDYIESVKSRATLTRTVYHDRRGPDGNPVIAPGFVPVKRVEKCGNCASITHIMANCLKSRS
ncbi:hypothetical protein ACHAPU_010976 [Fusarium lateritium]